MDDGTRFNRQPDGTFGPGNMANPGGRPHGLGKLVRSLTDEGKEIIDTLLAILRNGGRERDRIAAAELLLAYAFGKPVQTTELLGDTSAPLRIIIEAPRPEPDSANLLPAEPVIEIGD